MSTFEKNKRLLHKMCLDRKTMILVSMFLIVALLACGFNFTSMIYDFDSLDETLFMGLAVFIMWISLVIFLLVFRTKKSGLFVEIEDIYANRIDTIGKVVLMKHVIETYSYQEKLSALEQDVYKVDISNCNKEDRIVALRAEIESRNVFETIFSIINVVLPVALENITKSIELGGFILIKFLALLIMTLWIIVYLEDMKRNKYIMCVLTAYEKQCNIG